MATCHLCDSATPATTPFLVQVAAHSMTPGVRVSGWRRFRARACATCARDLHGLAARRRALMAALGLGIVGAFLALGYAAALGVALVLAVLAVVGVSITITIVALVRRERALVERLAHREQVRAALAEIPAGGLIRTRTVRIFTRARDLDGQPTEDLDALASTPTRAAAPGSARARLYRD